MVLLAGDGEPKKCVSRKEVGRWMVLEGPSAVCKEGGLEGARRCSKEVMQFTWSPSPVAGLGIGHREGGHGG